MDKIKYPSDKFAVAMDVMDISKDDMLEYLSNPENKYGFESIEDFENFILENLKIMMGGNFFLFILKKGVWLYIYW